MGKVVCCTGTRLAYRKKYPKIPSKGTFLYYKLDTDLASSDGQCSKAEATDSAGKRTSHSVGYKEMSSILASVVEPEPEPEP